MTKNWWKAITVVVVASLVFTLVSGCGSKSARSKPEIDETPLSEFKVSYDPELEGAVIEKYVGHSLKVCIPDEIEGEPVVKIGENAFGYAFHYKEDRPNLMYVYIPDTVKEIGEEAFYWCPSLTSIELPTSLESVGDSAFGNCDNLTSVLIPYGATVVGGFCRCEKLTSIEIPNSVTTIDEYAFFECTSLTNVAIPESVKEIFDSAFWNCPNLDNATKNRILEINPDYEF